MRLPNPLPAITKVIGTTAAQVVDAFDEELDRLNPDPPPTPPAAPVRTEINCTGASTQTTWKPTQTVPASPRAVGFGRPS